MALQKLSSLNEDKKLTQNEMQKVMGGGTYTVCTDERRVWDSKYYQFRLERTTYKYDDSNHLLLTTVETSLPSNVC